jgi:FtsH-binding integral membrane protein
MAMNLVFLVACAAAFAACVWARRQERREGVPQESSTALTLTGSMFLLSVVFFASSVMHAAQAGVDPCVNLLPQSFEWYLLGCWWW